MRLSERLLNVIKTSIRNSFGEVDIYLFGSRVDDTKKGGDIDLAIDIDISKDEFKKKKIAFVSAMFSLGFDLKIDVVPYKHNNALFFDEIHTQSTKLT